jgi:hypothetical protein
LVRSMDRHYAATSFHCVISTITHKWGLA